MHKIWMMLLYELMIYINYQETYLFDFDKNVYGEEVTSSLVEFIRPERKFENINELKKQIEADMQSALKIFKSTERNEANE